MCCFQLAPAAAPASPGTCAPNLLASPLESAPEHPYCQLALCVREKPTRECETDGVCCWGGQLGKVEQDKDSGEPMAVPVCVNLVLLSSGQAVQKQLKQ